MSVHNIMTRQVSTVGPADTVRRAIDLLETLDVRHLPVVDGKRLVGMVSDRDLREYRLPVLEELADPEYADGLLETPVGEVMESEVVTADVQEDANAAVALMLRYGIGAVPVTERSTGQLVGIVSYVDILRLVKDSL